MPLIVHIIFFSMQHQLTTNLNFEMMTAIMSSREEKKPIKRANPSRFAIYKLADQGSGYHF